MILEREQINRYLRHIIIPEISGPGQKKLLESKLLLCSESLSFASPFLYYAAAAGIGHIYCNFQDDTGLDALVENIRELNSGIAIHNLASGSIDAEDISSMVLLGSPGYISNYKGVKFIPTVTAVINGYKGIIQTSSSKDSAEPFLQAAKEVYTSHPTHAKGDSGPVDWSVFSSGFAGTAALIEYIKLCLAIGTPLAEPLFFDLMDMEFIKINPQNLGSFYEKLEFVDYPVYPVPPVSLSDSRVLIVGTGGLGSPSAYALSMAGIGTLGLMDYDSVDISNLNRQIMHSYTRLKMPKVESAKTFLKKLQPKVTVETYETALSRENAFDIIKDYDIVVDGVDNFPARYLLNDACFFLKKPMAEAGVLRFDGLSMTIVPGEAPCYRCVFPNMPSPGSVPSCSESGILGPVPGVMGFIQAVEVVKLLLGVGKLLAGNILFFDGLDMDFRMVSLNKSSACPICGSNPTITSLQEYNFTCDTK